MATTPYYGSSVSSTNWENSYFGGYERVIYDHPDISVSDKIEWDAPRESIYNSKSLSYYTREKLIKLFLLKVNQSYLSEYLFEDCKIEKYTDPFTKEEIKYLVIAKSGVKRCMTNLVNDTELGNLFKYYRSTIEKTVFSFQIVGDDKKDGDGEEARPSDGDEKKGDDGLSEADKMAKAKAREMIGDVKARKPFAGTMTSAVSGELKDKTEFRVMKKKPTPTVYSADEVKDAENLLRLLDISFDPKSDKIENLKAGKLSAHKIAEIPAGNTNVYFREEENQSTKPFSICILGDESGSMRWRHIHTRQNSLIKMLYKAFSQILPPEKIFIYGHSGSSEPRIRVYNERYNPIFEDVIDGQLSNDYSENYDGPVVECVYERVRSQTSDNIIFLSISDGEPSGHGYGGKGAIDELKRIIEKCKRDGFVTVGVGLNYGQVKEIYQYHTVVVDDDRLVKSVSSLINRVVKTEFQE